VYDFSDFDMEIICICEISFSFFVVFEVKELRDNVRILKVGILWCF